MLILQLERIEGIELIQFQVLFFQSPCTPPGLQGFMERLPVQSCPGEFIEQGQQVVPEPGPVLQRPEIGQFPLLFQILQGVFQ